MVEPKITVLADIDVPYPRIGDCVRGSFQPLASRLAMVENWFGIAVVYADPRTRSLSVAYKDSDICYVVDADDAEFVYSEDVLDLDPYQLLELVDTIAWLSIRAPTLWLPIEVPRKAIDMIYRLARCGAAVPVEFNRHEDDIVDIIRNDREVEKIVGAVVTKNVMTVVVLHRHVEGCEPVSDEMEWIAMSCKKRLLPEVYYYIYGVGKLFKIPWYVFDNKQLLEKCLGGGK